MSTHMQLQPKLPRGRALSTSTLLPRGGTLSPRTPALRGGEFPTCQIRPASRAGFTLVELLVVIGIIALLAALVTPAVMQAQVAARNAAIKAEIDMLHMAIMNYKNEYGSFPPAISTTGTAGLAAKHIQRLFPRTVNVATQVQTAVTIDNSLVGWLSGYTDDPSRPVIGSYEDLNYNLVLDSGEDTNSNGILDPLSRVPIFDFDKSRVSSAGTYYPSGKPNSYYRYIPSSQYLSLVYSGTTASQLANYGAQYMPATPFPNKPSTTVPDAWRFTNTNAPSATTQTFFNDKTFQILCAGRDEEFGTDDDLSNFWPGTRKAYLDSLTQ